MPVGGAEEESRHDGDPADPNVRIRLVAAEPTMPSAQIVDHPHRQNRPIVTAHGPAGER
jgi:hypothetical protein